MRGKHYTNIFINLFVALAIVGVASCSNNIAHDIPINHPLPKINDDQKSISLLTFNIQAIFGKDSAKLDGLVNYINQQKFDFITLQELFNDDARNYIQEHTDSSIYKSAVPIVEYSSFPENIFKDAGLFMKSCYPQVNLDSIKFGKTINHSYGAIHKILNKEISISTDFLANKSILGSLHQIDDSTKFFICTTHIQAIGSGFQKRTQLRQIKKFIENSVYNILKNKLVNKSENLIVLLTGDFNADAYSESTFAMLQKFLGAPRDLHKEHHNKTKEYTMIIKPINYAIRFDYIFAYDKIGSVKLRRINIHSINVTEIKGIEETRISDHYALKASIIYE